MTIWFTQQLGRELRFIDYYENSGESLHHYAKVLKDKPYLYGEHWAPPDIKVREMSTQSMHGGAASRFETAKKLGVNFRIAPKLSVEDGIDRVRMILGRSWFDKTKCELGVKGAEELPRRVERQNQDLPEPSTPQLVEPRCRRSTVRRGVHPGHDHTARPSGERHPSIRTVWYWEPSTHEPESELICQVATTKTSPRS